MFLTTIESLRTMRNDVADIFESVEGARVPTGEFENPELAEQRGIRAKQVVLDSLNVARLSIETAVESLELATDIGAII